MALIVEDGSGLAGANSYNSLTELNTYHTLHGNTAWAALSDANKEIRAVNGAQALDAKYSLKYVGVRNTQEQGLEWPRAYAVDSDGFAIGSDVIPQAVKNGHAELSLYALPATIMPPITTPGNIQRISKTVGPVSKAVTYAGGSGEQQPSYPLVTSLLSKVLEQGGGRVWRG